MAESNSAGKFKPVSPVGLVLSGYLLAVMWFAIWRGAGLPAWIAAAGTLGWFLGQCLLLAFICEHYAQARRRERQFSLGMLAYAVAYLAVDFAILRLAFREALGNHFGNDALRMVVAMFMCCAFIVFTTLVLLHAAEALLAIVLNVRRLLKRRRQR